MATRTDRPTTAREQVQAPSGALHRLVLLWVALPFVLFWLPLVRSVMDGPTYQWGSGWWGWRLGGAGLEGDLWYLVSGVILGLLLLWSGARAGAFFRWAAPLWMLLLLADAVRSAITDPEGFVFYGDTLGIRVNLTWLSPTFHLVGLIFLGLWLFRWKDAGRSRNPRAGNDVDLRRILAVAALLPLQFALLRFGEPHGTSDAVGVLITIGQWFAVPWALGVVGKPNGSSRIP
jgi:hypothetical protein